MREERYVKLCKNMKHGRHTLHPAGGARDMGAQDMGAQASPPAECTGRHNICLKSTMRKERYVMLCENMKHGRYKLHPAGGAQDMGAQASPPAECSGRHNIC